MKSRESWLTGWERMLVVCRARLWDSRRIVRAFGLMPNWGNFLGLGRLEVDQFLRDHGVELAYEWEDLEREREIHRKFSGSEC